MRATSFAVRSLAIVLGLIIAAAWPASAAVEQPKNAGIFVQVDGIPGTSADEQHKGQIEALQFNWSMKDKTGGVDPTDGLILKPVDAATPKLMKACAARTAIPTLTVSVYGTTGGGGGGAGGAGGANAGRRDYLVYVFHDVRLTVVSHAVVNSAQEQVQFSYAKVTIRHKGPDGAVVEETWEATPGAKGVQAGGR